MKVTILGDSISVGKSASMERNWTNLLARAILRKDPNVEIRNCSAYGRTSRQALEEMPYLIQGHRPDVLIIQLGLNDATCWKTDGGVSRVGLDEYVANLKSIVDRALLHGTKHIVLLSNHPVNREDNLISHYACELRERCDDGFFGPHCILVDTYTAFLSQPDVPFLQPCGVHLNLFGIMAYYLALKDVILPLIEVNS